MSDCTVYIDEAGDLGINRGTKWFVLTAVIADKNTEPDIRAKMAQIRSKLHINEIHMRKIADFNKRAFVVRELDGEEFTYMNVLVDTTKLDIAKAGNSDAVYNRACRYLLESVSAFLESTGKTSDIVLSSRGTSHDSSLITYMKEKLLHDPCNNINSAVFNKISAQTAGTWDLLQLADVCATTMFWAYEINGLGFCTPCFVKVLKGHLYSHNGRLKNYGVRIFAEEMEPDIRELRKKRICAKKKEPPVRLPRDGHAG